MSDTYVVAAERDHIVPGMSSYESTGLPGGDVRVVLNSGGHIAGIVNPANPKLRVLSSDANPPCAQRRRDGARQQRESWWEDWARWMADRAGPLAKPSRVGSRRRRVRADGPRDYVHGLIPALLSPPGRAGCVDAVLTARWYSLISPFRRSRRWARPNVGGVTSRRLVAAGRAA